MPALAQQPPNPCLCGHTINFEKSEDFCTKNADVHNTHMKKTPPLVRTEQTPLP